MKPQLCTCIVSLLPIKGKWRSAAGKVTVGPALAIMRHILNGIGRSIATHGSSDSAEVYETEMNTWLRHPTTSFIYHIGRHRYKIKTSNNSAMHQNMCKYFTVTCHTCKKTYDRGPYISHTRKHKTLCTVHRLMHTVFREKNTRPNYVIPEQSVTVTVLIKIQFVFKFSWNYIRMFGYSTQKSYRYSSVLHFQTVINLKNICFTNTFNQLSFT